MVAMSEKIKSPIKVFIIETKVCTEKLNRITEMMNKRQKDYKQVYACTIADYIVTELKSPSRIIRNVKKSTCPVLHISWLYESLQSGKMLDTSDYFIDVKNEREKLIAEGLNVDKNKLPDQLTWNQIVTKRLTKQEDFKVNSGLRERSHFMKRTKSSTAVEFKKDKKSPIAEKPYSTQPLTYTTKATSSLETNTQPKATITTENPNTHSTLDDNSKPPKHLENKPELPACPSFTLINSTDRSSLSVSTEKPKKKNQSFGAKDVILISDSEEESNEPLSMTEPQEAELEFSITSSNNNNDAPIANQVPFAKEHLSCSVEEITQNASSFDETLPSSVHTLSILSSNDVNSSKYSLSNLLSL